MTIELNKKEYIGDGVFAHFDGFHVVLSVDESAVTSVLKSCTTTIALDDKTANALVAYIQKVNRSERYEEGKL